MGIPMPQLPGITFGQRELAFLVLMLTTLALFLYSRLSRSTWGKAMRAIRDSETAGRSIALNPVLIRTTAFALSAVAAGIAGGVYAAMSGFISPESFPFFESILFLLVVMIGGTDRVAGPLVGAVIVVLLPELLASLAEYRLLFMGALLLLVLRLAPGGAVGLLGTLLDRFDAGQRPETKQDIRAFLAAGERSRTLYADSLSISFGGVDAVAGFSFQAQPGRITSIIGPNGAGKTTALNLIGGFYRPDRGRIYLGERDVSGLPAHRVARAGIARTYQTTQLFEQMSVLDNVMMALRQGILPPGQLFRADNHRADRELAESLLVFVGYAGAPQQLAGALAHVDKRLVEIARALALQPGVLLLDEPAAGLDPQDTKKLGTLLRQIADLGLVIILVEHDMNLVMTVSDHIVVLDAGRMIASAAPEQVRNDPVVLEAYLGEKQDVRGWPRAEPYIKPARDAEILSAAKLKTGYGAAPVLRAIDLKVAKGELVAVLGANGAGKSTLLRALSGLHRPVAGSICLLEREIGNDTAHRIAAAGLSLVPEGRQVFPGLSVIDNIKLGAFSRGDTD
jgi:ABC-type branched-subunit amino acid transport system ATPase component